MRYALLLFVFALAVRGAAIAQVVMEATITDTEGRPLPMAHVHLKAEQSETDVLDVAQADAQGVATLALPQPGIYYLLFTGVGHRSHGIPLLVADVMHISVTARLAAHGFQERPDSVLIIGDFNEFDFASARLMKRNSNGTYSAEIPTTADSLRYQVISTMPSPRGPLRVSINGTQSDGYEYDGAGDYMSVVKPSGGVARITFDPSKVARSSAPASVTFADTSSIPSLYLEVARRKEARINAYNTAYSEAVRNGMPPEDFRWDPTEDVRALISVIRSEPAGPRRSMALLEYFSFRLPDVDTALAHELLATVSPASALWVVSPSSAWSAAAAAADNQYMERAADVNPSPMVRSEMVSMLLGRAYLSDDTAAERRYYTRLLSEFPDSPTAKSAARYANPDRKIRKGAIAPDFSFAALDDSTTVYTKRSFAGRYLLLDFWATWCGPCIGELRGLTEAVEEYRGDRLEVLSISFDAHPDTVRNFRTRRYAMPWLHTFAARDLANEIKAAYEVYGIPRPVLIDPDGRIVGLEADLRGDALKKTLARLLGDTAHR